MPDVGVCKYYLGLVPHGSFAQHRDLGSGLLLQTFDGVALRSQNLPHEIELVGTQNPGKSKLASEERVASPPAPASTLVRPRRRVFLFVAV